MLAKLLQTCNCDICFITQVPPVEERELYASYLEAQKSAPATIVVSESILASSNVPLSIPSTSAISLAIPSASAIPLSTPSASTILQSIPFASTIPLSIPSTSALPQLQLHPRLASTPPSRVLPQRRPRRRPTRQASKRSRQDKGKQPQQPSSSSSDNEDEDEEESASEDDMDEDEEESASEDNMDEDVLSRRYQEYPRDYLPTVVECMHFNYMEVVESATHTWPQSVEDIVSFFADTCEADTGLQSGKQTAGTVQLLFVDIPDSSYVVEDEHNIVPQWNQYATDNKTLEIRWAFSLADELVDDHGVVVLFTKGDFETEQLIRSCTRRQESPFKVIHKPWIILNSYPFEFPDGSKVQYGTFCRCQKKTMQFFVEKLF